MEVTEDSWKALSDAAWDARQNASIITGIPVGAALLADDDRVYSGCNVEHQYRSHDIHAEVNAIGTMIAAGGTRARAILVVAEATRFTPCGACMDWIIQFGGVDCLVGFQRGRGGKIEGWRATELMPHYPAC